MKQKPCISTQISVLTRDERAKICTKIQAKTTLHYDELQRSVLVRDMRAKICTKMRQRPQYIGTQKRVLKRDIWAKICTKIEAKTTLQ